MDLREVRKERALAQDGEAEEGGKEEEEEETPIVRKGRKMTAPPKKNHATLGSTSTPKKRKVYPHEALMFPSPTFDVDVHAKFVSCWSL